jgi:hypothetical protein
MRRSLLWGGVLLLFALSGCSCGKGADDGGTPPEDAGLADGGEPPDAGAPIVACEVAAQPGGVPAECAVPPTGACQTSADCLSGLCLQRASGSVCTGACAADADCDAGSSCAREWTGAGLEGYCVPQGRAP